MDCHTVDSDIFHRNLGFLSNKFFHLANAIDMELNTVHFRLCRDANREQTENQAECQQ